MNKKIAILIATVFLAGNAYAMNFSSLDQNKKAAFINILSQIQNNSMDGSQATVLKPENSKLKDKVENSKSTIEKPNNCITIEEKKLVIINAFKKDGMDESQAVLSVGNLSSSVIVEFYNNIKQQ